MKTKTSRQPRLKLNVICAPDSLGTFNLQLATFSHSQAICQLLTTDH